MEHVFTDLASLTQRDQAFLQFIAQVALHADSSETAIRAEGFDDRQIHAIRAAVARLRAGSVEQQRDLVLASCANLEVKLLPVRAPDRKPRRDRRAHAGSKK